MAERALTPDEQALAHATKRAVQAAGGLQICERETGRSDTQISRCCSPNQVDSITIRDAAVIDGLSHGTPGHPHILRALARVIGGVAVIVVPELTGEDPCLRSGVIELTHELGEFSGAVLDAFRADSVGGERVTPAEAAIAIERLDDVDRVSRNLRHHLEQIARGARPTST